MSEIEQAEVSETPATSRRNLIGKGAVAAAAAAVAGVAMSKSASAIDGGNVVIGTEGQTTQTPTELLGTSSFNGGVMFLVNNTNSFFFGPFTADDSSYRSAIAGWGNDDRVGVYGFTQGAVPGVVGYSAGGTGVAGRGDTADFEAIGNGRVVLTANGVSSPTDPGTIGSIAKDPNGNLWYCYAANKWTKLGGSAAAGAFHAISPVRVYDSRAAAPAPGVMAPNTNRVISVKDGRNAAGVVTAADVVPLGATAVTFNVTASGTTGGGNYLSVNPGDAASFTASTLNWAGGYDIANASVVKLDASRQVKIFMGDQGGSSHVILDITGYYL
jgi:hypothetical protein